jgi:hypothetical protein
MPVPFAALVPLGIITVMFGATGGGLRLLQTYRNEGKPPRYNMDMWDTMMMDRDERLTGTRRGQSDNPTAPKDFATSSGWKYETPIARVNI